MSEEQKFYRISLLLEWPTYSGLKGLRWQPWSTSTIQSTLDNLALGYHEILDNRKTSVWSVLCPLKSIIHKLDCREFDNRKSSVVANNNLNPVKKLYKITSDNREPSLYAYCKA